MEPLAQLSQVNDLIWFGVVMIGIIFAVYRYFRDPQVKVDKNYALLAQSLKDFEERMSDRFSNFEKDFTNLRDNHIHTLEVKIDDNNKNYNLLAQEVVKLSTIINERVPKKTND